MTPQTLVPARIGDVSNQTELLPAVINAKVVFRIGIILWLAALLVLGVLHLSGVSIPGRYPIVAIAGLLLGMVGYWWAHHNHMIDASGHSQAQPTRE